MSKVKGQMSKQSGQLLLEILIVISVVVIVAGLASQMVVVSMQANKTAGERNVALGLAEEVFEAVRSVSAERWQNIYGLGKGSANHYYPQQSNGKWVLATGEETVNINGLDYSRYFIIDNTSRDSTTRDIEATYNLSNDDPSTQKITVSVNWGGGENISFSEYATRWRNKVCFQTDWSGGMNNGPLSCPANSYSSENGDVDLTTPSALKIKPL